MIGNITLIAEVKTESPFGFVSEYSWQELLTTAEKAGDVISIHTDRRWGGSFELLAKARKLTKKPILAKGLHQTDEEIARALACGADYVLVVGRIPAEKYFKQVIIEPYTLDEIKSVPKSPKLLWNSRDLETGGLKTEMFEEARKIWDGWLCQASNIKSVSDIKPGADAVLVGTHLHEFLDSIR